MDIINVTQARSNLSKLVSNVFLRKKKYILIRDSVPQAVIVPYDEYQDREQAWQDEVEELMRKGKKKFGKWLLENKKKRPKNEKEAYKLVDKIASRS